MKVIFTIKPILHNLIIAIILSLASLSWAEDTTPDEPEQIVQDLQSTLIQAMREGDNLDFQGRYNLLEPVINQSHDLDLIIRTVLGGYWSELDSDQQRVISDTFRELSIATYAGRFKEYGGEHFEILQQRDLPRDQLLIRSQLTKSNKSTVDFDYVFQQKEGNWHIANILVNGVSDLALKRSEYRAILKRDGYSALIEMLKEKIDLAEHI